MRYNTLNVKLSNSQLNKSKFGIKSATEVTLKLSSIFPHKLLLTKTQVSKLRKAFANNSSSNTNSSITQLHKIGQLV